jgi:hypothetical protein
VFAWHLFLQRLGHRHHQDAQPAGRDGPVPPGVQQDQAQDVEPAEPREVVRALLAAETPKAPVTGPQVQAATGLSRSRAYAVLRELRAEPPSRNGHPADLGRDGDPNDVEVAAP